MPPEASNSDDPKSVDSLLAEEFFSLSFQDRNAINEEMHGVLCCSPEETTALIRTSLERLEDELSLIPAKEKKMYELCQERYGSKNSSQEGGTYVNDVDFRVRILRCELFDIQNSARKLVDFLETAVELFGEYALRRPIRLSDFTEEELQIFRMGNMQLLPFRDRSGRRIIAAVEGLAIQFDSAIRFKMLLYLLWAAGDDNETQSKGVVAIIWPVADVAVKHLKRKELIRETQKKWIRGLPTRACAFHFCVPDTAFFHTLKTVFTMMLMKRLRSRIKFHVGQMIELQYLVKGYGVPVDHIPLTGTGNVKTQNLRVWLKLRSTLEDPTEESAGNIIECPYSNDVLFRPSKLIKGHPGNVKFHSLIEYYHEKGLGITAASKKIINDIFEDDGRILVWEKRGWWTNVTDPGQMQFKVSVSYRDYKNKKKQRARAQAYNSSTCAFQEQDGRKRKRIQQDTASMSTCVPNESSTCSFLNGGSFDTVLIEF